MHIDRTTFRGELEETDMPSFRIRVLCLGAVSRFTRGGFTEYVREADRRPYDFIA